MTSLINDRGSAPPVAGMPSGADDIDTLLRRANDGEDKAFRLAKQLVKTAPENQDLRAKAILACLARGRIGDANQLAKQLDPTHSYMTMWADAARVVAIGDKAGTEAAVPRLTPWLASSPEARLLTAAHAITNEQYDEAERLLIAVDLDQTSACYRSPAIYAVKRHAGAIGGGAAIAAIFGVLGVLLVAIIRLFGGLSSRRRLGPAAKALSKTKAPNYQTSADVEPALFAIGFLAVAIAFTTLIVTLVILA